MQLFFRFFLCFYSSCFNPHPARRPDATFGLPFMRSQALSFQSSSGPKAGCNLMRVDSSITTRSFQSSSGPKAGCNPSSGISSLHLKSFNPHPARRPDATSDNRLITLVVGMFQSSSGPKAGCNAFFYHLAGWKGLVSILIRPEGRMQHARRLRTLTLTICFNPHPARRPDATRGGYAQRQVLLGFNPHPARRPDATG